MAYITIPCLLITIIMIIVMRYSPSFGTTDTPPCSQNVEISVDPILISTHVESERDWLNTTSYSENASEIATIYDIDQELFFQNGDNCGYTFTVVNGNGILVEVLQRRNYDYFSYVLIENLDYSRTSCDKKFTSIPLTSSQCSLTVQYQRFMFHVRNADILIKIRGHSIFKNCSETNSREKCRISRYDEVAQPWQPYAYGGLYFQYYFPIVPCHNYCVCNISYREWSMTCDGLHETTTFLIYDEAMEELGLHYMGIDNIASGAFKGLAPRLINLFLQYNRIKSLERGVFSGLFSLEYLSLENNSISILSEGFFSNLNQLWGLDLQNNQIRYVSSDAFDGLFALEYVLLQYNSIEFLKYGTFSDLRNLRYLYLDFNSIGLIENGAFIGLDNLLYLNLEMNFLTNITSDTFLGVSSQLMILNLANNEIESLPTLSEFTQLFDLFLTNNSLKLLPDGFLRNLTQLENMHIDNNHLVALPNGTFQGMLQLKFIYLQNNSLESLPAGAFKGLETLEKLYLQQNQLTSIPEDAFEETYNIRFIYLSDNQLMSLPSNLFLGMTKLESLRLQNNNISILSTGMFQDCVSMYSFVISKNNLAVIESRVFHSNLRNILLEYNKLKILTRTAFSNITQVRYLIISRNTLSSIFPGSFDGLYNLFVLFLDHNQINALPRGLFDHLNHVAEIHLNNNQLRSLPRDLFHNTTDLSLLFLHYNSLTSLPDNAFHGAVNMVELNLTHNSLTILPNDTFSGAKNLLVLDLTYNRISILPETSFASSKKIATLYLDNNNLSVLPENIFNNLTELLFIDLSANSLRLLPANMWQSNLQLQFVNMSYNQLTSIPFFKLADTLRAYDLSYNSLDSLHQNSFLSMFSLIYLSLDHNAISQIPARIFEDLGNIEILNLGHNLLKRVEKGTFSNLFKLITLDISNNLLTNVDSYLFASLLTLEYLLVQQNQISVLPTAVFDNLTQIKSINLSFNSIHEIQQDIISTNSSIETFDLRFNDLHLATYSSFAVFANMDNMSILVDNFATCCFSTNMFNCISQFPRPIYLTCRRMLDHIGLRVSMWFLGLFAVFWNGFVFFLRFSDNKSNKVQSILILNLAMSDFLMGVSMVMLASVDAFYNIYFPSYSDNWRRGPICKLVSILSLLSSEASVFFITLISFDRFQGAKNPFSARRIRPHQARLLAAIIWIVWVVISVVPSALSGISEKFTDVYEVSEVCVGIPMVRRPVVGDLTLDSVVISQPEVKITFRKESPLDFFVTYLDSITTERKSLNSSYLTSNVIGEQVATYYSIVIFIGINLFCFIFIAILYIQIFNIARRSAQKAGRKQKEAEELRMAVKMSAIVLTDFFTWVPLIFVSILAQFSVVSVSPVVYAWTVAFILPFNSAINPFLYTLIDRKQIDTKSKKK